MALLCFKQKLEKRPATAIDEQAVKAFLRFELQTHWSSWHLFRFCQDACRLGLIQTMSCRLFPRSRDGCWGPPWPSA